MNEKNHQRGGRRPGAGRPALGEKSSVVRVPDGLKPAVQALLARYRIQREEQPPSAFPPEISGPAESPPALFLPLYGETVPAGFPSPASDYVRDRLDLNQLLVRHPEATFFVQAKGHSMLGAGIHDGDKLVVDRALQPRHGHVVIAVVDGEFTVKRLYQQGGVCKLRAENPEYPDIVPRDGQSFEIFGVVTSVIHPL